MKHLSGGQPEDSLLRDLAEGREEAFAELYNRFGHRLFRAAFGMLGSHEEAEELVQEVFMNLFRARRSLAGVENLTGYVFAALRHAVSRRKSQLSRWRKGAEAAREINRSTNPGGVRGVISANLEGALNSLTPEQREVIALKIDAGLTFAEIGAALDVSPNTAASRYRYALEKLRAALREE